MAHHRDFTKTYGYFCSSARNISGTITISHILSTKPKYLEPSSYVLIQPPQVLPRYFFLSLKLSSRSSTLLRSHIFPYSLCFCLSASLSSNLWSEGCSCVCVRVSVREVFWIRVWVFSDGSGRRIQRRIFLLLLRPRDSQGRLLLRCSHCLS